MDVLIRGVLIQAGGDPTAVSHVGELYVFQILPVVCLFIKRKRKRNKFGHDHRNRIRHVLQEFLVGRIGRKLAEKAVEQIGRPWQIDANTPRSVCMQPCTCTHVTRAQYTYT